MDLADRPFITFCRFFSFSSCSCDWRLRFWSSTVSCGCRCRLLVSLRVCRIGLGGDFVPDPTPFAAAAAVLAALLAGASVASPPLTLPVLAPASAPLSVAALGGGVFSVLRFVLPLYLLLWPVFLVFLPFSPLPLFPGELSLRLLRGARVTVGPNRAEVFVDLPDLVRFFKIVGSVLNSSRRFPCLTLRSISFFAGRAADEHFLFLQLQLGKIRAGQEDSVGARFENFCSRRIRSVQLFEQLGRKISNRSVLQRLDDVSHAEENLRTGRESTEITLDSLENSLLLPPCARALSVLRNAHCSLLPPLQRSVLWASLQCRKPSRRKIEQEIDAAQG
eukprot:COSAG06_NODE_1496_length_9275_cov_20.266783_15_plen_334_part_00